MTKLKQIAALLCLSLWSANSAMATVACSAVSPDEELDQIPLYAEPSTEAAIVRDVPLGDLLVYPQEDFAPTQAEGWAWVRHDESQEDIWQSGETGWVQLENLADCG